MRIHTRNGEPTQEGKPTQGGQPKQTKRKTGPGRQTAEPTKNKSKQKTARAKPTRTTEPGGEHGSYDKYIRQGLLRSRGHYHLLHMAGLSSKAEAVIALYASEVGVVLERIKARNVALSNGR